MSNLSLDVLPLGSKQRVEMSQKHRIQEVRGVCGVGEYARSQAHVSSQVFVCVVAIVCFVLSQVYVPFTFKKNSRKSSSGAMIRSTLACSFVNVLSAKDGCRDSRPPAGVLIIEPRIKLLVRTR